MLENLNLEKINPKEIAFDNKNPRGESADIIEKDKNFKELVNSVHKFGILVPVIVMRYDTDEKKYKLIDGERRVRAALLTGKDKIPAHIVKKEEVDGLVLAFQIHTNNKQWSKVAKLKSIKEIIEEIKRDKPKINDDELIKNLKEKTNLPTEELKSIFILLNYSEKVIDSVLENKIKRSYFIEIEKYFLPQLKNNYSDLYEKYGEQKIREIFGFKALSGKLMDTRYIRDKISPLFDDISGKLSLKKAIISFFSDKELTLEDLFNGVKNVNFKKTKRRNNSENKKIFEYKSIRIDPKQQTQIDDLRPKFERISSNFSNEEIEYINEALFCIEKHCFKAAALMIWASGISKILKYISKDTPLFNKKCTEMKSNPKKLYKHYAKDFCVNSSDIDELKDKCKDTQFLCYLYFVDFITVTEFKRLKSDFDIRNDSAHPTDIKLKPNEIISTFEHVFDLILNNIKLQ